MMISSFLEYYRDNGRFISHQIESFNDFIENRLQQIIDDIGEVKIDLPTQENLVIRFGKVMIGPPEIKESDGSTKTLIPMEARLRKLTYSSTLYIEMTPVFEDVEHETTFVNIGDFPVMVKSNLCPLAGLSKEEMVSACEDQHDMGGYFIINGVERVLILFEDIAPNRLIFQKKKDEINARIDSKNRGYTQRHVFERKEDGMIVSRFANITTTPIPVVALIKALGIESDKDMMEAIFKGGEPTENTLINLYMAEISGRDDAIEYIGKILKIAKKEQVVERVEHLLDNYLLPHLGQDASSRVLKARYLANVMAKMDLLYEGKINDDIDHYGNKRLRLAGDLLESVLRSTILGRWGLVARLQYNYQKMIKRGRRLPSLQSIVITGVLTKQIMRAMAVGDFANQTGVSQRLERSNFVRALGHLRGVVSPLSATQEHYEARELHATHWGRLCAVRTPEGQNIGLRKFLALGAQVTTSSDDDEKKKVLSALNGLGVKNE
ncbi:MAG: DNA-directed RNA polymerase subunit B'' [Candidatus Aenigmarchaeota archaeon]|nr:DNA-directed RNA polymerase subunit B'' [Candidatus Aenigmarchaeota archaeon]